MGATGGWGAVGLSWFDDEFVVLLVLMLFSLPALVDDAVADDNDVGDSIVILLYLVVKWDYEKKSCKKRNKYKIDYYSILK